MGVPLCLCGFLVSSTCNGYYQSTKLSYCNTYISLFLSYTSPRIQPPSIDDFKSPVSVKYPPGLCKAGPDGVLKPIYETLRDPCIKGKVKPSTIGDKERMFLVWEEKKHDEEEMEKEFGRMTASEMHKHTRALLGRGKKTGPVPKKKDAGSGEGSGAVGGAWHWVCVIGCVDSTVERDKERERDRDRERGGPGIPILGPETVSARLLTPLLSHHSPSHPPSIRFLLGGIAGSRRRRPPPPQACEGEEDEEDEDGEEDKSSGEGSSGAGGGRGEDYGDGGGDPASKRVKRAASSGGVTASSQGKRASKGRKGRMR